MSYLLPYKVSSTRIFDEIFAKPGIIERGSIACFNTPVPPFQSNAAYMAGVVSGHFMTAADYPNQMFASSIDLNTIKRDILAMDQSRLETEELENLEAFMALSADVISDLINDEPDIYTIDDVKVRFR